MLSLLFCVLIQISCSKANQVLGFYWGDSEHLNNGGSHFENDIKNITVPLIFMWLGCAFTAIWTFTVILYHWFTQPPYKFTLTWQSRTSLRIHIISGSLEFVGLYMVYFMSFDNKYNINILIIRILLLTDIFHALTSYYQVPSVFGQKYLIIPGYIWIITLKLLSCCWLNLEPLSYERLLSVFWYHSTFTWIRLLIVAFKKLNLFKENTYSVAALVACLICQSFNSGYNGILLCMLYTLICGYVFQQPFCSLTMMQGGNYEMKTLAPVQHLNNEEIENLISRLQACVRKQDAAAIIFDFIDQDHSHHIRFHELSSFLLHSGVSLNACKRIFDQIDVNHDKYIEKDEFINNEQILILVEQFTLDLKEELSQRIKNERNQFITIVSLNTIRGDNSNNNNKKAPQNFQINMAQTLNFKTQQPKDEKFAADIVEQLDKQQ